LEPTTKKNPENVKLVTLPVLVATTVPITVVTAAQNIISSITTPVSMSAQKVTSLMNLPDIVNHVTIHVENVPVLPKLVLIVKKVTISSDINV
jgi:hypothetical protein